MAKFFSLLLFVMASTALLAAPAFNIALKIALVLVFSGSLVLALLAAPRRTGIDSSFLKEGRPYRVLAAYRGKSGWVAILNDLSYGGTTDAAYFDNDHAELPTRFKAYHIRGNIWECEDLSKPMVGMAN